MFDNKKICGVVQYHDFSSDRTIKLAESGLNILLVLSGKLAVQQNESTAIASTGSIILAQKETSLIPIGAAHIIGAQLCGVAPAELAAQMESSMVINSANTDAAQLIHRLCSSHINYNEYQISAMSYTLLCEISQSPCTAESYPRLAAEAISAIKQNYADIYGVEELSETLGVSKSHLVRSFSAATGKTPGKYLTEVRVSAAKQLLLHREYSLEVIATLCGFSGANYLCKVFKKETGQTCNEFRQNAMPASNDSYNAGRLDDMLFL